ncbi:hypothetical protein PVAND_009708 [Polypedilum vanderplanki]|uniref:Uncharacterized protein n=1 Tax=Polypedilum vanderplanki TaxID=319348 RepID=A0A9J6CE13_POLVA|nr:hypothetical protein PVAND_009708 [Polypedilum vanderplanki]
MLKTSKQASKPVTTKTASSILKNEKQKQKSTTTSTKISNPADKKTEKKTIAKKSDSVVGLSTSKNVKVLSRVSSVDKTPIALNKKNVMNTVHNVTVASPPTSAGKARSTSMINVREVENAEIRAVNHSRSRTRTIAPEESLLYQQNLLSSSHQSNEIENKNVMIKHNPVAYEINFDDEKKSKKLMTKQKSLNEEKIHPKIIKQKSMIREDQKKELKREKSIIEAPMKSIERQKSMIKDQLKAQNSKTLRKPLEKQKTVIESELPPPSLNPPSSSIQLEPEEDEENYESDFESYESDFEVEPSEEEEQSTDNNESEVNDNFVEQTTQINDKIDKERIDSGSFEMSVKKSATPSSAQYDSIDDTVNSHDSGISYEDLNALNKRLFSPKVYEFYKRGEELMKKITFDEMTFDLFEQKPIPYEVFMSVYGQRGMTQTSTQSDSNTIDAEIQTEIYTKTSAWTQFPAKFTKEGLEMFNSKQYNEEKLGVGIEIFDFIEEKNEKEELDKSISAINNFSNDYETLNVPTTINYNTADLNKFLQNASITISNIIESKANKNRELTPSKISISRGYLQLKYTEIEILRNTIVTKIYTNLCLNNFLITIHKSTSNNQTLMCLWNIFQINQPLRIFTTWNNIKCIEIHPQQHDFIVGGCDDGTLCLWNTQELNEHHEIIFPCEVISLNQFQNNFALDNVVALKSIPHRQFKTTASMFLQSQASQIASLHENGVMSIWTLLQTENVDHDREKSDMDFIDASSKVKLIKNLSIDLTKFTKNDEDENNSKSARKKSAFDKTRYYFENDLFSDKVLRELQEIDIERLNKSKKLAFRDDNFTAISFDVNFNELFVASDSNFIVALSRLCLGDKARKIITSESNYISASIIKVHPINKNILAIGQSNGSVKFIKTNDESNAVASKQRKQLKRSYATTGSSEENVLGKSCAFQNIVEREKKLYEETQALNNLESDELKAFLVNEQLQQQMIDNEEMFQAKVKITFDKNIFNSFEISMGSVKAIEFNKSGELMFILINKTLRIFNCWSNSEIENYDNQKFVDIKCIHGSDGTEYLVLLTTQNEILVNKLKF